MKYIDFLEKFGDFPLIDLANIRNASTDFRPRQLYEWQKRNKLTKIKNGFYVWAGKDLTEDDFRFISNKLVSPSYLSLEYALSYYSLIPEMVYLRTNITSKKTAMVNSPMGNFSYRSVKENLFFGYVIKGQGKIKFKIAEPEKALLDFLYLRTDIKDTDDIESLRLNSDIYREIVSEEKLNTYCQKFNSLILNKKIKVLMELMKHND